MQVKIYTDGGSRGNPGPAGIGAIIEYEGKQKRYTDFIGENKTNNEAEYEALIFALKKLKSLLGSKRSKETEVVCYSDSELIIKQLNHEYKLKDSKIQAYFVKIWNLMLDFGKVEFAHIPRERNTLADKLANEAMDVYESKKRILFDNS